MSKNPLDEFLEMNKTAGPVGQAFKAFPRHLGQAAAGATAAAAVGLAGAGLHSAIGAIVDAATKSHDFRQMMEANEDLHTHYETDPKKFNLMFNTLRSVNPEYSKDPLVAGSFMRRMIESPTGIGGIAGEALQHRGDYPETAWGTAHDYAREGAKSGLQESIKMSPNEALRDEVERKDLRHKNDEFKKRGY